MSERFKTIGGVVLRVLFILWVMETVFYFMTPEEYGHVGYIINFHRTKTEVAPPQFGFNEVDPLLGYAKTFTTLQRQGLNPVSNCVLLSTTEDTAGCLNILITGGSTSDLSLYPKNWPLEFRDILKARGIRARIYCAGVGGYNSGQELLKLIRDGVDLKPWVHISYSGANEFINPSYVSKFEQNFYEAEFDKSPAPWLLPNTFLFARDLLHLHPPDVKLHHDLNNYAVTFWEKNMRLMHGIASENNYRFFTVLQPVLGSGKYTESIDGHRQSVEQYQKYYPELKATTQRYPDFMVDMTAMFDTCTGQVFMDNCHVNDPYQQVVALNIYNTLAEKGVFTK